MRKLFALLGMLVLVLPVLFGATKAANVTDLHWVTRNDAPIPFVRMVFSLSSPVQATASISASGTSTTLVLKNATLAGAPTSIMMDDGIAKSATLSQSGSDAVVKIETPKAIDVEDLKVFTLKKDTVNNKPYRMVVDIQKKGVAPRENYYGKKPVAPVAEKASAKVVEAKAPAKEPPKADVKPAAKVAEKSVAKPKSNPPAKPESKAAPNHPIVLPTMPEKPVPEVVNYRTTGGIGGKTIVLDPGHGGSDPGAIGPTGLQEKQVTLPIAEYLKSILEAKGAKVILTRTTDVDVYGPHASGVDELQARVNVANGNRADAFISIHINSFSNPNVGGIATYYFDGSDQSKKLASAVQGQIAEHSGFNGDRGIQPGNLYVLRHSLMPSILVELGFISNPKEEGHLKETSTRQEFANELAKGLELYFGG
ncbi:N-acetylmuramoyl-L-alanine amidase [Veillonella sp. CHU732]|uniref:N-acetylmuramoyl-L-alanine amidase family protein n=1 Tax=Veillonella sp. CHU732 TaxID=2490949 RepID=UPI000F8CDED4|nr:N-acetylmuramoyl-L-alanine amidase [Veillonella sp. CHU732]